MPAHKTLFLLRRPIEDPAESLLPSTANAASSEIQSLVLLEQAVSSPPPSFHGQVYVLQVSSNDSMKPDIGKTISYSDLVSLIAEHDTTIVL